MSRRGNKAQSPILIHNFEFGFWTKVNRQNKDMEKEMPIYLEKSKLVLARIWRTSLDDDERPYFQSLID